MTAINISQAHEQFGVSPPSEDQPTAPSVTVVVAAYNAASTIGLCLSSVLGQSFTDLEVIVCDDSSVDGTSSVVSAFSDARLRLIRNDSNLGPGPSRDQAIAIARGDWIAVVDADDSWSLDRLATLMAHATPEIPTLLFDDIYLCTQRADRSLMPTARLRSNDGFNTLRGTARLVTLEEYISAEALLIKPLIPISAIRSAKLTHGSRTYAEDAEFFVRLMHSGVRAKFIELPLYYYRLSPVSLSATNNRSKSMAAMLRSLDSELVFSASVRAAISGKLRRLARKARYEEFLAEVQCNRKVSAARMLAHEPSMGVELMRRLPATLILRLKSWWHGTSGR